MILIERIPVSNPKKGKKAKHWVVTYDTETGNISVRLPLGRDHVNVDELSEALSRFKEASQPASTDG